MADEERLRKAHRLAVELGIEIIELDEEDEDGTHYWSWRIPWPKLPSIETRDGDKCCSMREAVHASLETLIDRLNFFAYTVRD